MSTPMKYRRLGDSGLFVSQLGFGCFTFSDTSVSSIDSAYEVMSLVYERGINFWDTAEGYGRGKNEEIVGQVIRRGIEDKRWEREDLVISTKICMGTKVGPNATGLSRKHLIEGAKASLQRLQLDYVDVIMCHRQDPFTPIEETVRAMNFIISQGWAFYWGTSEWLASEILEACEIADRLGLIRPVCDQPQYNLLERSKVDNDFLPLFKKYGLGLTTYSPLQFGLLTGKYANGIPEDARLNTDYHFGLFADSFDKKVKQVEQLRPIAEELGCTLAQLALAWVTSNPKVSTLLLGASSIKQLEENLKALDVVPKLTADVKARIEAVIPIELKVAAHDIFALTRNQFV
ncbi:hypothetical protein Poli38472_007028 [Pythium oligandrum]|uniref:NADP-dependent oxidoreductase domain-containing protein n=1 Tax=Pythium oligandrum TaxID=41045 RepID=A0A8K1C9Z6_PYTOL|nr:hypothetical protein Poli38472_007028 [Pythium oligandrum]|eukprot:TMW58883.1 hypothetical protein Poli38472_007028 [Pythium oligandrum]